MYTLNMTNQTENNTLDTTFFKKYDVRGKYPEQMTEEVIIRLVDSILDVIDIKKILIGHDTVIGSKFAYPIIIKRFRENGVNVLLAGEVSSSMLYFATGHYKVKYSIMLTASHLGEKYTGIKPLLDGIPFTQETVSEIKEKYIERATNENTSQSKKSDILGSIKELENLKKDYLNHIKEFLSPVPASISKSKVVFDISNGANSYVIHQIAKELLLDYSVINEEILETNLSHETNPKIPKNREQLVAKVQEKGAEIGIMWDGDCDRAYFVDNTGHRVEPEFVGTLITKMLMKEGKGNTMTIDIRGSHAVEEIIEEAGGKVIRLRAWHVPIKHQMSEDSDVVFGMETSGHYVFRDMYKSDDGLVASLLFLKALALNEKSFKELLADFRSKYYILEEINYRISKPLEQIISELKEKYSDGEVNLMDGISITYPEWRFNLRSSLTEPLVRLNISGKSKQKVDENLEIIVSIIDGEVDNH